VCLRGLEVSRLKFFPALTSPGLSRTYELLVTKLLYLLSYRTIPVKPRSHVRHQARTSAGRISTEP
jgi:hypothetical protein